MTIAPPPDVAPAPAPLRRGSPPPTGIGTSRASRLTLRFIALGWLAALLVFPVGLTLYRTFSGGVAPVIDALTAPEAISALEKTVIAVGLAVPLNTFFGIVCALLIVRGRVRGRAFLQALLDLPFAVSPVVLGLALYLVFAPTGWLGPWFTRQGVQVLFATPSIVIATIFVSLPYVVNELVPILDEIGTDQEEAAATLGARAWATFRRITLPSIRWGLAYGVVLTTARALGEFGAVSIVSGNLRGQTQTLTVYVEDRFQAFDLIGAYAASALLALLAIAVLLTMTRLSRHRETS
jgi:sulfate transport system permease protein